jgi:acyl dehydratase
LPPTVFKNPESLLASINSDLGYTDWFRLDPQSIAAFAAATGMPGDSSDDVAPPLMVLALTNWFLPQLLEVQGVASGINYGTGEVRFNAPVRSGDRLRARAFLLDAVGVPGGLQTTMQIRVEIEGSDDMACIVESLSRWMV